jgi:hypothetical protein
MSATDLLGVVLLLFGVSCACNELALSWAVRAGRVQDDPCRERPSALPSMRDEDRA